MIRIHIDEIRLRGLNLPPGRREQVRQEAMRQLHQLLSQQGLPPGSATRRNLPDITVPARSLPAGASDSELARALARAIYESLR